MEIWHSIILGLVQGIGEFLPISSSGHLVLTREILGISGDYLFFDVMLHVGSLFAIFVVFFKDLIALFKPPFKTIGYIILASIPAVVVAFFFKDTIEGFFASGKYICFFFLFTAMLMFITEIIAKKTKEEKPFTIKNAMAMGVMQAVAIFPGISRSGSTIFGGVLTKGKREEVAKFSFFMSIPVILGSALLEIIEVVKTDSFALIEWGPVIVGMIVSFLSALFAIKLMMKVIAKANYKWFSLYLVIIAILSFIFIFF